MFIKSDLLPIGYVIPPPRLLSSGRKIVTPEQREVMRDLYENHGLSTWKIGKAMGYLNVCIINNLKKAGVKMRNRSDANKTLGVNREYFKVIDTPTKAYLLGFFYADGNLHKDSFTIALQERDKYILEDMAKEIGYNGELSFRKKQNPNKQNMWALRIHDKEFAETLRQVGIVERKTSKVRFPEFLDKNLTWSFIHGLADGDGCVSIVGKRIVFTLAGAKDMVLDIKKIVEETLGINFIYFDVPRSKGKTGTANGSNAVKFLHYLYLNSHSKHWLTRKRDKFVSYLYFRRDLILANNWKNRSPSSSVYINILSSLNETSYPSAN